MELDAKGTQTYWVIGDDPLSAGAELTLRIENRRADWRTVLEGRMCVTATAAAFHISGTWRAFESDEEVFVRTVDERVERDLI